MESEAGFGTPRARARADGTCENLDSDTSAGLPGVGRLASRPEDDAAQLGSGEDLGALMLWLLAR